MEKWWFNWKLNICFKTELVSKSFYYKKEFQNLVRIKKKFRFQKRLNNLRWWGQSQIPEIIKKDHTEESKYFDFTLIKHKFLEVKDEPKVKKFVGKKGSEDAVVGIPAVVSLNKYLRQSEKKETFS